MELCLLHTQKKIIITHSEKKIVKKKKTKICSKVLTLKTASGPVLRPLEPILGSKLEKNENFSKSIF